VSIRVLVVEDEPVVRSLAVDVLTDAGYETVEAANATQALDVLANSEQEIDVLFRAAKGNWLEVHVCCTDPGSVRSMIGVRPHNC
jgi:CheY-like chemotaxis protein